MPVTSTSEPPEKTFAFRTCPEMAGKKIRHRVAILGAGPVGLCAAIDFARHGIETVVLDARDDASDGSRAICWAKRTLEICDRLGTGDDLVAKGVTWNEGEVFVGDDPVYSFNLLPEDSHRRPAFINLQQFHFEYDSIACAENHDEIDLRWQHRATGIRDTDTGVEIDVETPEGTYTLNSDWLIACDGVRSTVRRELGLDFEGRVFQDRFLIADIRTKADYPAIRRFWFDPVFAPGQSALMHKQADDVWRCDFQLGWDSDPNIEREPDRVVARIRQMLGDVDFEIVWTSVYTFTCRRLEKFRHGRIFFAGDSAHVVSPFGARGGNGGIQDSDNLVWKLAAILDGNAPEALLDSYDAERIPATDENILNSTRSTDFITPKTAASRHFRDAVLDLAHDHPFARHLVNSGRLSVPARYDQSPLNGVSEGDFSPLLRPGTPCLDAPVSGARGDWLLDHFGGEFVLMFFGEKPEAMRLIAGLQPVVRPLAVGQNSDNHDIVDVAGLVCERYDGASGTAYLIRPDQHVAARWRRPAAADVSAALDRALCRSQGNQ